MGNPSFLRTCAVFSSKSGVIKILLADDLSSYRILGGSLNCRAGSWGQDIWWNQPHSRSHSNFLDPVSSFLFC